MNLVTREKVLQGIAEVKEGITFCCSLPLDYPGGQVLNPRRGPPRLAATSRDGKQFFCRPLVEFNENMTDVICDDQVLMSLQYSTQWDSFAHVGSRFDADGDGKAELVFYNGFRAGQDVVPAADKKSEAWDRFEGTEAKALGIQGLAEHGAQGRGVLIDLHHHFQRQAARRRLRRPDAGPGKRQGAGREGRHGVPLHRLRRRAARDEEEARPEAGATKPAPAWTGATPSCCSGSRTRGLACLLADNYAVELIAGSLTDPLPRKQPWLPLHEHCLFKNGIHLGEMFYFSELARWLRAHKRNRFLFTAPPLRLPGAVGSPATPIATV